MPQFQGLSHCGSNFSPKCATKSIQFVVSSVLFILILFQFFIRIRKQRQINFFAIVSIQMLISLICNMTLCWFHQLYIFYYFQVFFFGLYFTTIVYKVALKLVEKSSQTKKIYWVLLHIIFLIYVAANFTVLILRLTNSYSSNSCNQIWYLTLQTLGIALSICMVMGGLRHQKAQKQKVSGTYKEEHLKNPMPSMWRWISINIISQTFGLIESLIFEFTPEKDCHFSSNQLVESILKLIFALIGYHLGMFATYLFFRQKYKEALLIKRVQLLVNKEFLKKRQFIKLRLKSKYRACFGSILLTLMIVYFIDFQAIQQNRSYIIKLKKIKLILKLFNKFFYIIGLQGVCVIAIRPLTLQCYRYNFNKQVQLNVIQGTSISLQINQTILLIVQTQF